MLTRGTYNQTVQVTEDGNSLGNDPGNDPAGKAKADPDGNRAPAAAVNEIGLVAGAEVDVLQTDVTVDNTSTNNLTRN